MIVLISAAIKIFYPHLKNQTLQKRNYINLY